MDKLKAKEKIESFSREIIGMVEKEAVELEKRSSFKDFDKYISEKIVMKKDI